MPSNDGTVVRENVAKIVCHIRRIGWEVVFDDLADEEPALAGYAMAAADMLSHRLQKEGVPYDLVLLIEKEMMTAQLACIHSMRQASRALWQDFLPGHELESKS